jgi:hypothetical protein
VRTFYALALGAALLAGCAGTDVVECHGQNWYRIGIRDATMGGKDDSAAIAASCGQAFDAKQYRAGFDSAKK